MNGHVLQCYGEATEKNQFARTVEELDSYAGLQLKNHPIDMKRMKEMRDVNISLPTDHAENTSKTAVRIWEKEVDSFVKRQETYEANKCALYSVIWNQCYKAMQTKLKSMDSFTDMSATSNSLTLLRETKGVAYKFKSQRNIYLALDNARSAFYAYKQAHNETNANYMSKFKNAIKVIEHYGGSIGNNSVLFEEELKKVQKESSTTTKAQITAATKTAKEKAHAIAFLKRADKARYGLLTTDLENQFTLGTDQYPNTITEAYNLLVNYRKP